MVILSFVSAKGKKRNKRKNYKSSKEEIKKHGDNNFEVKKEGLKDAGSIVSVEYNTPTH